MREFYYLRELKNHPHITKLFEIIFTETSVYMILEFYPSGDLFEYVTKQGNLEIDEALRIFVQIAGAVHYLHKNGCCHRDLKLENVLLDKQMNVKLSDFGFTRELPFIQHGPKSLLSEYCGTGAYMAPEIVQRMPYSGIKIDIWALGVILYTMLSGEMPFDDSLDTEKLEYAIINSTPRFLENVDNLDSNSSGKIDNIKYLMNKMLSKNVENRIASLDDILGHPFLASYGAEKQLKIVQHLMTENTKDKRSWTSLSSVEKTLFKDLVNAGVDREMLKRAIQEETLDSVYGIWSLLQDQKIKKEKKSGRLKSRSMLKLTKTRSKSIIGNARQAFSSSPSQSDAASSTFLSRSGSLKRQSESPSNADKSSLNRTGSYTKNKRKSLERLNSIDEYLTLRNSSDQLSVISKNTQHSDESKKHNKAKIFKPLLKIFKPKHSHESKWNEANSNDSLENNMITNNSHLESLNGKIPKISTGGDNRTKASAKIQLNISSPVTPDQSAKLKRTKPTRPGSEISVCSAQSATSETSNGSGYITGYSTDINMLSMLNPINNHLNITSVNTSLNNNTSSHEMRKNSSSTLNLQLNGNDNQQPNESAQFLNSPQNSNRPRFSRAVSDWSVTFSQAESPNSSFVALSRTNSVDSSSNRKKKGNTNVITSVFMPSSTVPRMNRRRSPLNAKMNTKWAAHNMEMPKTKPTFSLDDRESLIIEEESSGLDDNDDDDDDEDVVDMHVVNVGDITEDDDEDMDAANNFYKYKPPNSTSTGRPMKSGRIYMRKKNMKFPIPPVTEENDQDLEDDADVEEDNHDEDYDDTNDADLTNSSAKDINLEYSGWKRSGHLVSRGSMTAINDKINRLSVKDPMEIKTLPKKRTREHIQSPPLHSQNNNRVYSPIPTFYGAVSNKVIQNLENNVTPNNSET